MHIENLFDGIPGELPQELFTDLLNTADFRIERIVSYGHSSPEGFWYNEDGHEWVILLRGSAVIEFEGETDPVELRPGSYVNIPAHTKHRVARTALEEKTVWLAIHY